MMILKSHFYIKKIKNLFLFYINIITLLKLNILNKFFSKFFNQNILLN